MKIPGQKYSNMVINGQRTVKGKMSIQTLLVVDDNGTRSINVTGVLITHRYFKNIKTIDSARYRVEGVDIVCTRFGTEDFDIVYYFDADTLEVKKGESIYDDKKINEIESKLYGDDKNGKKG